MKHSLLITFLLSLSLNSFAGYINFDASKGEVVQCSWMTGDIAGGVDNIVKQLEFKTGKDTPNCFFRPELEDEVIVGFFNNYRPQFLISDDLLAVTGGDQIAIEELALIIMQSIEKAVANGEVVNLVGFGSFGPIKVKSDSGLPEYDYGFIANPNLARHFRKNGGSYAGMAGIGLPKSVTSSVIDIWTHTSSRFKGDPAEVTGKILSAIIASESGASSIINIGPSYFYEKGNKAAGFLDDGTPVRCWNSTTGNMFASHYEYDGDNIPFSMIFEKEEWFYAAVTISSGKGESCILLNTSLGERFREYSPAQEQLKSNPRH